MTVTTLFQTDPRLFPLAPLFFARQTNRELNDDDFDDDAADDFDRFRPRRPRRRLFLKFTLILLLITGVWYIARDPDMRSIITRVVVAINSRFGPETEAIPRQSPNTKDPIPLPQTVPVPVFREGQRVAVVLKGDSRARLRLSHDVEGTDHGPSVKTGDVCTIIDGRLIKHRWIYIVQTKSGASGWIQEDYLRAHSQTTTDPGKPHSNLS